MNIELIIDLTDEQKQSMQENSVTNKMFNKRINQGWSIKESIGLPRTFKQADKELEVSYIIFQVTITFI